MENEIIFKYAHCTKEDFQKEVSFNEEEFTNKLSEAFDLDMQIDRIEVTFHQHGGQGTDRFEVSILVISPELKNFDVIEKGSDTAGTTRAAIEKTIQMLRKENDKKHNHHK
jgi:hypothetical protein